MGVGNLVVQLGNAVVAVTGFRDGAEEIVQGCRKGSNRTGTRPWPETVRADRGSRGRTRGDRRIRTVFPSRIVQQIAGQGDPSVRGLRGQTRQADPEALLLIIREIEELILENGPTHRRPVIFVAQRRGLGNLRSRSEERGMRGEGLVPVVIVGGAVQGVAAGASHQIDRAAGVASRLRARLRLGREFHHRVDGQHDAGNPRDAALVDRRDVVPQIVVVHAVDLPVDLIGTRSVEGAEAAHVVASEARLDGDQLREIPAVQRNVLDHIGGKRHALRLRRRVEGDGALGNLHRRRCLPDFQLHRQRVNLPHHNLHVIEGRRGKAARRGADRIQAGRNILEGELALRCGHAPVHNARRLFRRFDASAGHKRSRWVQHGAVDGAAEGLRTGPRPIEYEDQEEGAKARGEGGRSGQRLRTSSRISSFDRAQKGDC